MLKGHPGQHQQNSQNPAQGQAQHDDGNDAHDRFQQVNQNGLNQPQNNQNQQANHNQNVIQGQGQQVNQQQQQIINYMAQLWQMDIDRPNLQKKTNLF